MSTQSPASPVRLRVDGERPPIVLVCAEADAALVAETASWLRQRDYDVIVVSGIESGVELLESAIRASDTEALYVLCRGRAADPAVLGRVRALLKRHEVSTGNILTFGAEAGHASSLGGRVDTVARRFHGGSPVLLPRPASLKGPMPKERPATPASGRTEPDTQRLGRTGAKPQDQPSVPAKTITPETVTASVVAAVAAVVAAADEEPVRDSDIAISGRDMTGEVEHLDISVSEDDEPPTDEPRARLRRTPPILSEIVVAPEAAAGGRHGLPEMRPLGGGGQTSFPPSAVSHGGAESGVPSAQARGGTLSTQTWMLLGAGGALTVLLCGWWAFGAFEPSRSGVAVAFESSTSHPEPVQDVAARRAGEDLRRAAIPEHSDASPVSETSAEHVESVSPDIADQPFDAETERPRERDAEALAPDAQLVVEALRSREVRAMDVFLIAPELGEKTTLNVAKSYCDVLEVAGLAGWRIPKIGELNSLNAAKMTSDASFWSETPGDAFGDTRLVLHGAKSKIAPKRTDWEGARTVCIRART